MSTLDTSQRHFHWTASGGWASGAATRRRRPLGGSMRAFAGSPDHLQRRNRRARFRYAGALTALRMLFRHVFALIQDFLRLCRMRASRLALSKALSSVLGSAGEFFEMNLRHPQGIADVGAGSQGCLAELQSVLGTLGTKHAHCPGELSHALDSLIVLLVRSRPVRSGISTSLTIDVGRSSTQCV